MAEAAYAYKTQGTAAPALAPSERQPGLRIVEQPATRREQAPARSLKSLAVSVVLAIAVLASVPLIQTNLVRMRMRMLVTAEHLEQDIAMARSTGHSLESQYSALTNPQSIQRQAAELGMAPDTDLEYLEIDDEGLAEGDSELPAGDAGQAGSMVDAQ